MRQFQKAAVIGAGVMGSGIAAHLANAGLSVLLLDIVPVGDAKRRSGIAQDALARMQKAQPPPFMSRSAARRVTPGNIEDDWEALAQVDWIIEAVAEKIEIKRALYAKLEEVRRADAILSSNTSTLPLAQLTAGRSKEFCAHFLITHFFNPPRYMHLLEVVRGPDTKEEVLADITAFADMRLGKGVVHCKDTPGFIANRIGTFWLQCAVREAIDLGLTVEEADAILGKPMGVPKTGVFGLMDLVGLDLLPQVTQSFLSALPPDDLYKKQYREETRIADMIAKGLIGRKGKGGFYRLEPQGAKRVKQAIDLNTGVYRTAQKPKLAAVEAAREGGIRALLSHDSPHGKYAYRVALGTLAYAASLVPTIAEDILAVDAAMRWGIIGNGGRLR